MTAYIDIAIGKITNDVLSEDGKVRIAYSADETIQRIRTCLRRIYGEWFLDNTAGLPYFTGDMLGSKNLEYVRLVVFQELSQIEGVQNVEEINIVLDVGNKKASIYARVKIEEKVYSITEEI